MGDFAKSIISYSSPKSTQLYLKGLNEKNVDIGFVSQDEFKAFKEFVADDLPTFLSAMKDTGMMREKKFDRIFSQITADNQYKLSRDQYTVLFKILDVNGDGKVSYEELKDLLENANKLGRHVEGAVRLLAYIEIWWILYSPDY
jgi:ssDNA-specific exonuclease RecJ